MAKNGVAVHGRCHVICGPRTERHEQLDPVAFLPEAVGVEGVSGRTNPRVVLGSTAGQGDDLRGAAECVRGGTPGAGATMGAIDVELLELDSESPSAARKRVSWRGERAGSSGARSAR